MMRNPNNGRVYYLCFYSDPEVEERIVSYPSVWGKIDYIVSAIKWNGLEVTVVSTAQSIRGSFRGFTKFIDNQEKHIYFSSRSFTLKNLQRIVTVLHWLKIVYFLLRNARKNDTVLVYHSLYHRYWLKAYRKIFRKHFILEIEDVFSSLNEQSQRFEQEEWTLFNLADACLCINDIVCEQLVGVHHKLVSYGSYFVPPMYDMEKRDKKRLVYAGVIEQERNAAFLAVNAMLFLPSQYELHILGFGSQSNVETLVELIDRVNEERNQVVVFFHGRKSGWEYQKFLQSCDIALSTHIYDENNMIAADHTFPSKVLGYMANGVRVVAQRIACLEKSKVGGMIWFYDDPTPTALADAIMRVDLTKPYDSRSLIQKMDQIFLKEIGTLINAQSSH